MVEGYTTLGKRRKACEAPAIVYEATGRLDAGNGLNFSLGRKLKTKCHGQRQKIGKIALAQGKMLRKRGLM
ncbi:MAG: hypothetical protein CVU16_06565 [Betaproteobacteria bacterium HGW-Betaproteobacteria-10]|nr:MAG: hypothetical protein CVU16_06565 [Betaproteobacteria bacterium HGW-Betaproteobacteria-10]